MEIMKFKVLICDDTTSHGLRLASGLREKGIYAYTRKKRSDVIVNAIMSDSPDVVVADLTLEDTDSIKVIEKVKSVLSQIPTFIITSDIDNRFIERQVIQGGASYFLPMPFDANKLYEVINLVACKRTDHYCDDAELMVTELIQRLGVPAHIKGYRYMRTAILECLGDKKCLDSFTKGIYPAVADMYETTPSRVERAIRHAIDTAWARGSKDRLSSFLGYAVDERKSRPTNSEFIALAADKLKLRMKTGC